MAGWLQNVRRRIGEAIGGFDMASMAVDADDDLYRRLSDRKGTRDLTPMERERALKLCRYLYDSNPLGGWLIDGRVDLLLGDELGFSVEVDATSLDLDAEKAAELVRRIKAKLARFWDHPAHNLRMRADEYITAYMLDGELCLPVAGKNDVDGVPELDFIDSSLIGRVAPVAGSSLVFGSVVLKAEPGKEPKSLEVVRFNSSKGILEGECFYFRNSRIPNAMRGRPEILRQADWIDSLDQFLFSRADRAPLMNSLLWDVTLNGAHDGEIKKRSDELRKEGPVRPGTTRVHNERETWAAVVPNLNSADASDEAKLLRNYILGSKSIPESWYAEGGDVNRATAGEQSDVALMALRAWRRRVRLIFGTILEYAYDSIHEKAPNDFPARRDGVRLKVDLPPLAERDISRLGGVVQNVVASLEVAVARGLISQRTAQKVFLHIVDRLGVPVDPDDEASQIEAEAGERAEAAAANSNRAALAHLEDGLQGDPEPAPARATA